MFFSKKSAWKNKIFSYTAFEKNGNTQGEN
jgi:hypothetical protein